MPKIYFVNTKTGRKYEVLGMDKAAGKVTLQGEHGQPFTEPYDKAKFEGLGYTLEKGES